ncbi:MAG: DinB family protein [Anaerolineales bacterium]
MDILDRLIAHDTWTTQQLLNACEALSDDLLDKEFDMDHRSLRETFIHMVENLETWTDLIHERPVQEKQGNSIPELKQRLVNASRDFTNLARQIGRENRFDDSFWDVLDNPPRLKTFGGAIGHVLTHNMHHRAQIMYLMEKVGIRDHIEGDLLSWETVAFGWA